MLATEVEQYTRDSSHSHSFTHSLFLSLFLFHIIKCNEDQLSSLSGIKRLKRVHSKRVLNPNKRLLKIQILCKTRRETIECSVSWSPFSNFLVLLSQQGLPFFLFHFPSTPFFSYSVPCSFPSPFFTGALI